jgi:hypothetical protein
MTGAEAQRRELRLSFVRHGSARGQRYDVAVSSSDGEREERPFRPELTQAQVEAALASTGDASKPTVRRSTLVESIDPAQDVGGRLFEGVFGGRMGRLYQQQAGAANEEGGELVIRVASEEPEIASLPWELLYDYMVRRDFIVLCHRWSLVRERDGPDGNAPPPTPPEKLRGLLIYTSVPGGPGFEQERHDLMELAKPGGVEFTCLEDPTLPQLAEALAGSFFHILHFIGNAIEEGMEQRIALRGSSEEWHLVAARELQSLLEAQPDLRLAFLNGCHTDLIARTLSRTVPAAIGMQGMVLDDACVTFSHTVYGELVEGKTVAEAVGYARKTIDLRHPGSRQWAMPVLYAAPTGTQLIRSRSEAVPVQAPPLAVRARPTRSPEDRRTALLLEIAERNVKALRDRGANRDSAPEFLREQFRRAEAEVAVLKRRPGGQHGSANR